MENGGGPVTNESQSFLDAAESILEMIGVPLSPREITRLAMDRGLLRSRGATPAQTMKSKLAVDVLHHREQSRFKRTDQNMFALRKWTTRPEFIADRFQKALLDEEIVVFKAAILREFFPRDGISVLDPDAGQELIHNTFAMQRRDAEETFEVVQLVSQFLVVHQHRIAAHKRTRRLPEKRLHGVHSLLFGGHLNPDDIAPLFGPFDPVNGPQYITRELAEEVRILHGRPSLQLIGGIYDPRREVSKQHLGVLYLVHVPDDASIEIGERGFLQQLEFLSVSEIGDRIDLFENWSELVFKDLLETGALEI